MPTYDLDLLVLGGGAAGLTAAGTAGTLGVKTMLVDRARLGGDCTWTGCVPSKTLLHAADGRARARAFVDAYGADGAAIPDVDFPAVMRHVRELREAVYHEADDPSIFEAMGVDVVRSRARLVGPHEAELTDDDGATRRVTFRMAVLCTGGRAAPPPIDGLDATPHLTNEDLFEIEDRPDHLIIVGAGPIGCEMGQAFRRLGSDVTIVDRADRPLGKDDADHARILQTALQSEGVRFVFEADVDRAEPTDGGVRLHLSVGGSQQTIEGDRLLVATGRRPNVENLGLDAAGVAFTDKGIRVDDRCRTSQPHIWAAGDCTGEYQLTHMSEHMAKTAVTNAVLKVPAKIDRKGVPWTTFTTPEVAQVGRTEVQLRDDGETFETYAFPYTKVDRAITESATTGQVKLHATRWRGKILGASVVGERAGEVAALYSIAMKGGVSASAVSDTIVAYPTYALAARRAADQWYVRKAFPRVIGIVKRVLGYRGTLPPPPSPDRIV